MDLVIREISQSDVQALVEFSDKYIGKGYFKVVDAEALIKKSFSNGVCTSFVLEDTQSGNIYGIRLAYAPGKWGLQGKKQVLFVQRWEVSMHEMAYFKTIYLAEEARGQAWGQKLSAKSIERLADLGAKGIVCHSWVESPHNSSRKYLEKAGFKAIADIPEFWSEIDYKCDGCEKNPCVCTATEMVKYL